MSPIEVSNRIRHGAQLGKEDRLMARRNAGMLLLTQDAIESWSRRYPRDPWIVRDERKLAPLFTDLETSEGDRGVRRCQDVLARTGRPQVVANASRAASHRRSAYGAHRSHIAHAKKKRKRRRVLGFL